MKRFNPREARRMMQRMGLSMGSLEEVQEVVIRFKDKELVINNPEVSVLNMKGSKIYQITGENVVEKSLVQESRISEEDIQLVAVQAKVSVDQAKAALEQTNGDLAEAILLLSS